MSLNHDRLSQPSFHWEDQPIIAWMLATFWVATICFIAFWWQLDGTGLVDETEPLFAEASRQMVVTGDWVTPYFNGITRFDKPPLVYWLMAIAFKVGGVNTWTVRFPSALAATGLTGLGFYTLKQFGSLSLAHKSLAHEKGDLSRSSWFTAWLGAALIALNVQTIAWARTGVSDMLLSGCIGAALFSFFIGYALLGQAKAQARWYLAFYILMALAVLTKGPVGLVLPGLIIGFFLLYMGNGRAVLQEMQLLRGILVFLALTVPWYVLVIQANGEAYINAFFGYHNLERFSRVVNNHSAPWWFFFAVVPMSFAPWSAYLPVAIARLQFWRINHWRKQPRSQHLGIFALIWFIVIFGFFTIAATKLPSYTIPLLPAAAVLVALFWRDSMYSFKYRLQSSRGILFSHIGSILFALLLAAASLLSPRWLKSDKDLPQLQAAVQQLGIPTLAASLWLGLAIASLILLLRRQGRWIWRVQLVSFFALLLIILLPSVALVDAQRQLPLRTIANTILQVRQPGERLMMVGYSKPSLVFYTRSPFTFITEHDKVLPAIQKLKRNRKRRSVLLVVRARKLRDTQLSPNQYQFLSQSGVFQLIRIPLQ
ncbi:MAG: glycosyltransferase family 39 protein [Timaviella obliquedivisa GSE-PSE-MK23-08B]|jgi:4-amino-4-deoxy-L-arabinose transferase-like glycosyltransferase|nr:glycosyltransferase family 39 protein [Timaviella obliquedivisa GSE-PSE-MK23-08B]